LAAVVIYALYTICLRFKPQITRENLIAALVSIPFVIGEWRSGGLILPGNTGFFRPCSARSSSSAALI
jgi:hypothetical protein